MITREAFISQLEVKLNVVFTDEQLEFIKNLNKPGICFASPGTGKTASAVAGLLTAELCEQVSGETIYALSFTNMATLELSVRHLHACDALGVYQRVNFKTLHSLCSNILRENYKLLGMDKYETVKEFSVEKMGKIILGTAQERNIDINPYKIRNVVRAFRSLNSSLTFERENVESKADFKDTGLNYEDFQLLRKLVYDFNKDIGVVEANNILLYTLEILLRYPEISEKFKSQCKLLLVDEAQDLSLLQLRILSLLSDNLVLIGDIKQQIYAFNGACQEIVSQYLKYFPTAWQLEFTQSFRCKNEIADFATQLILNNKVGGENFKGCGAGGIVTVEKGINYKSICQKISDDYLENKRNFPKGILFLFRNNLSAIPVAEELFKLKVPFRINNYTPVIRIPIIKDLCALVDMVTNEYSYDDLRPLSLLIPEFREYRDLTDSPFYKIMESRGCSLFNVKYKFRDEYCGERVMSALLDLRDKAMMGARASDLFNSIYPLYKEYWLSSREKFMEYDAIHYLTLANYVVRNKGYRQLVVEEREKEDFIKECNESRRGVRCFTFHAAKGLEDDIVYMIDCDADIVPNAGHIDKMLVKGCTLDIAREIRNERSLVYVASTRAKSELHIHYNDELSSLLTPGNIYDRYDMAYENFKPNYRDVEVFQEFYE